MLLPEHHFNIADLHCDLLWFLSLDSSRTPFDLSVRCAVPQLLKGNVSIQVLPIYAETHPESVISGMAQAEIYRQLPKKYPDAFEHFHHEEQLEEKQKKRILLLPAIENASAVCDENENLDKALERLTQLQRRIGKLLYVSLTWNTENRFGGGTLTRSGLKDDGKRLIDYLHQKGIAIDFSHTSDHLAYDMLNYFDKQGIAPVVMASHSNLRKIANFPRNLPDDLAKEIIKRNGVIGLNFIRFLVGKESINHFSDQLAHVLSLGGSSHVCLGADFFCTEDMSPANYKPPTELFFENVENASQYENVIGIWRKNLGLGEELLKDICRENFVRFIKRQQK